MYVANSERADLLPPEVVNMIQDYDPEGESILAMVDSAGEAACVSLSANEMGSTPRQLFEEAIKAQQHVPIVPGTMVRIKESRWTASNPACSSSWARRGADMILAWAGEDYHGEIVPTDEVHRVHVDYRDAVVVTGMSVPL